MDTRDRILDVAVGLFAEVGYDKASIRELASRLGFTTAALYYHFRNKQEILTALAETVCVAAEELVALTEKEPASPMRSARALERYLALVAGRLPVMTVLESSIATLRTLDVGKRMAAAMNRLATLVALDDSPESEMRATAALGIITTVPQRNPGATTEMRRHVLAAAYGALTFPVDELG